jgi:hypothetical protein
MDNTPRMNERMRDFEGVNMVPKRRSDPHEKLLFML